MPKHLCALIAGCAALLLAAPGFAQTKEAPATRIPVQSASALRRISPAELKGDLSFLASDTLAGRFTPSPGLDVAAEFIASKFRAVGLEPGGDQDYFQSAHMVDRRMPAIEGTLTLQSGKESLELSPGQVQVYRLDEPANLRQVAVLVFPQADPSALQAKDVRGKAVVQMAPDFAKLRHDQAMAAYHRTRAFSRAADAAGAALELVISPREGQAPASRLLSAEDAAKRHTPILMVFASNPLVKKWFESASETGAAEQSVSVNIPAPQDTPVTVKNVVGILRGSDPKLKSTCVLLTAHYDHIGTIETGRGMATPSKAPPSSDHIYNGANDDGSGTVSVIEIARALSTMKPPPRRSIVFMTFFGEERGELGSQFYTEHPIFPLVRTVADINLEQVGRTDSTTGPQINTASLTGYDYSNVTKYVENAGKLTGIKVYKDPQASDPYFTQSDNSPLAEAGIPAHSLTVAFDYPDYHGLGDEWQKIDYNNMARVDRMVALSLLDIAQSIKAPAWNGQNAKTEKFREAQEREAGR